MSLTSLGIGQSGLNAFSKNLESVSNNVTNLNTTGFKASQMQFAELFSSNGNGSQGQGVHLSDEVINFKSGDRQITGNPFDLKVNGSGYFVLKDENGGLIYTKDGAFDWDKDGVLVSKINPKQRVMAYGANGVLQEISLRDFGRNAPLATTNISYNGSATLVTAATTDVIVFDNAGGGHALTLNYRRTVATEAYNWTLDIKRGSTILQTIALTFNADTGNMTSPPGNTAQFQFTPPGASQAQTITLNMQFIRASSGVPTSNNQNPATTSTGIAGNAATANGHSYGTISEKKFDVDGNVIVNYTNGESSKPFKLALANFQSAQGVHQVGGGRFRVDQAGAVNIGVASKEFGEFELEALEASNVELTDEFSKMIVLQRGYQASSQIINNVNEMLQELIKMAGGR